MTKLITIQLNNITPQPITARTAVQSPLSRALSRTWTRIAKITKVFSAKTSLGSQPQGRPQEWSAQMAPMTIPAQTVVDFRTAPAFREMLEGPVASTHIEVKPTASTVNAESNSA